MLYVKEMDEAVYGRLCAVSCCLHLDLVDPFADRIRFKQAYFSASSELHGTQIKALLGAYLGLVKKASEEDGEYSKLTPLSVKGADA